MDKRSEREFLIKEDSDSPNAHLITHIENERATGEGGPLLNTKWLKHARFNCEMQDELSRSTE